jgi:hypothetical protein
MRQWVGPDGSVWRRAGDAPLKLTAARRLIHDQAVEVVLFNGVTPQFLVTSDERVQLWSRIDPVLRGRPVSDPYLDYLAFRFRDDAGNRLLAIEEHH